MSWVSVTLKNKAGNKFSVRGLASDVFMDDKETSTVQTELARLDAQEQALATDVAAVTASVSALEAEATSYEDVAARTIALNANVANLLSAVESLSTTISGA